MHPSHASSSRPLQWQFAPAGSVSPRQCLGLFLGFALVLQAIGIGFSSLGADLILGFTSLELVAVGLILVLYVAHAQDRESVQLNASQVLVEINQGSQTQRYTFDRSWVQVHLTGEQPPLLRIHQGREGVCIGRFVPVQQRSALAQQIRQSIQGGQHV